MLLAGCGLGEAKVSAAGRDYTIDEWCEKRRCCRATFYNLQKIGKAPVTIKIGARQRITLEADARWELERTREAAEAEAQRRSAAAPPERP